MIKKDSAAKTNDRDGSSGLQRVGYASFIVIFALALPQSSLGPQIGGAIRSLIFNVIVLSLMFPRVK